MTARPADAQFYMGRHMRFGWWALLCFVALGLFLEIAHGFKLRWYLSVANETRRLMMTLAHAHGTLIALMNIVFGATQIQLEPWSARPRAWASRCLLWAGVLLPLGFLLGGLDIFA